MGIFNPERHPLATVALVGICLILWWAVRHGAAAVVFSHVHVGVR